MNNENSVVVTLDDFSHENMYDLFIAKEHEGYLWRMDYVNAYLDKKYDLAEKIAGDEKITFQKFVIDSLLEQFTLSEDGFTKMLYTANCFNNGFIKDIECDRKQIKLKTIEGDIVCRKLSAIMPEIENIFPYINSKERQGMCHSYSMRFAMNFNMNCDIVTGYVAPLAEKNKNLHTWVEFNFCGEDVVVDFTRGLMFNKEGYYLLKNIKGPVHKINRNVALGDMFKLNMLARFDPLLNKLYFANRDQAMQIYDKRFGDGSGKEVIKSQKQQ